MLRTINGTSSEWLPGGVRRRITDLCGSRGITQAQLASDTGITRSTLSRFCSGKTDSLSDSNVVAIAKRLNVSTDFLLCETDIPDRERYDISELGLTAQAARNLYTRKVDPAMLCELLEHEKCGDLLRWMALYRDGVLGEGVAAQNQLYQSMGGLLELQRADHPEDAEAAADASLALQGIRAMNAGAELEPVRRSLFAMLKDIRGKKLTQPAKAESSAPLTKAVFAGMVKSLRAQARGGDWKTIGPERIVDAVMQQLGDLGVPPAFCDEMAAAKHILRDALCNFFDVLKRAKACGKAEGAAAALPERG